MKKRNKILAVAFILLFTGAFFGSGVLKSDGLPSILERSYVVVNDNMTVGVCCQDGDFVCEPENCLEQNNPE